MTDHHLTAFQFETHTLSVLTDENGDPWFIAAEACAILNIKDVSDACARLDDDEKKIISFNDVGISNLTLHSELKKLLVNEPGLYTLILGSRKKSAKTFKRWVTHDVLPQIRKTGSYHRQDDPVERYPELKAIRELIVATAEARDEATLARQEAHAAEVRAIRAEAKADLALESAHTMTVEEFVVKNGLLHQFPPSSYKRLADWLGHFCQQWGIDVGKAPVYGKPWDNENAYPVQAFGALLRAETKRPKQIALVKE